MTGPGDAVSIKRPGVRTSGQREAEVRKEAETVASQLQTHWRLLESGSQVEDNYAEGGRSGEGEHHSRSRGVGQHQMVQLLYSQYDRKLRTEVMWPDLRCMLFAPRDVCTIDVCTIDVCTIEAVRVEARSRARTSVV